ncbi:hypothetical protein SDC9_163047 [bioreactor metagenome]|uniref:Uncharacterized protein n=1 Tax=bioreactor metagenome TaxID=1076179 RepID=A0A645FUD4_9ZZZZ
MHQRGRTRRADNPGDFRQGTEGAHLIVHQHDAYQHGVGTHGRGHSVGGDATLPVRLQARHLPPRGFQRQNRLQHGGVLDGRGEYVRSLSAPEGGSQGNSPIVALGAAGGKVQLLRGAAKSSGHCRPAFLSPAAACRPGP